MREEEEIGEGMLLELYKMIKDMSNKQKEILKRQEEMSKEIKQNGKSFEEKLKEIRCDMTFNEETINKKLSKYEEERKEDIKQMKETFNVIKLDVTNFNEEVNEKNMSKEDKNQGEDQVNLKGLLQELNQSIINLGEGTKFSGDKSINPKMFINTLRQNTNCIRDETRLKSTIRSALKGNAETWYNIIEANFKTFDEFKDLFLKYYWSEIEQQAVRDDLFTGRYIIGQNRDTYAMKKISQLILVEPPYSEQDIVMYLARHFETEVRNCVEEENIKTTGEFLEMLKRFDLESNCSKKGRRMYRK